MAIRRYDNTERTSVVDIVVDLRRTEWTCDWFRGTVAGEWSKVLEGVMESLAFISDVPMISIGSKLLSIHDNFLKLPILYYNVAKRGILKSFQEPR